MGTNIHLAAEVFKDGRWHLAEVDLPIYPNYRAFFVLADVRNGYTFAGMDSGDPVIPISYPRGFPKDMSLELRELLEGQDKEDWLGDEGMGDFSVDDEEPEGNHEFLIYVKYWGDPGVGIDRFWIDVSDDGGNLSLGSDTEDDWVLLDGDNIVVPQTPK